ncbi:GNAT family N-acetyltransferase [Chitinophaga vietnamensis]|uniref:GNAT family N-acetyltransferase n=1 Tax=Chitinophaga vietnamensis TaxID=2593957 RepID=UPI00117839AA|nr:GNAT family N-acetyltransferase [Chitinophaga vietnamensis]
MTRTVHYATDDAALEACKDVILVLRPHIAAERLIPMIKEMQEEDGYQLVYVTADEDPSKVAAVAGFRHMHKLHSGRTIYIDDLVTSPHHRNKGYAALLLDHVHNLAKKQGVDNLQLDSGHALAPAHKLYFKQGYYISAHHFTQKL